MENEKRNKKIKKHEKRMKNEKETRKCKQNKIITNEKRKEKRKPN